MSLEIILNIEGEDDHIQNICEDSLVDAVLRDIGVQKMMMRKPRIIKSTLMSSRHHGLNCCERFKWRREVQ